MPKLTFVLEDGEEVVVPITERVTIGRTEDNDVMVDDERISPQHAELLQNADGSIQVFDLKSTSGTFVNGERQISCTLLHGDRLEFGPLVAILDLEDLNSPKAPADKPAPPPAPADKLQAPAEPPPALKAPDTTAHADEMARMEAEKARLKAEVDAAAKELRDWELRAEKERAMHNARMESLREEEKRLVPIQAAARQAESAHQQWLEAIEKLTTEHTAKAAALSTLIEQHDAKAAALHQLTDAEATTEREIAALTSRLQQTRDECEQDETLLNGLRQQIIEMEKRLEEGQELAATREDQVRTTEKKIAQLEQLAQHLEKVEANIQELSGSEARLKDADARRQEIEATFASLTAACTDLEARKQQIEAEIKELESSRSKSQQESADIEARLNRARAELDAETQRLQETQSRRAEIERECQELADTKQQLADARQRLAAVEQRHRDAQVMANQMAVPRRNPEAEEQHDDLTAKIEAARRELADLEAKTSALRAQPTTFEPSVESPNVQAELQVSDPLIVHVEAIRLAPVRMKSESTRTNGAGRPVEAKAKAKKS